jgi:hypothetical protein
MLKKLALLGALVVPLSVLAAGYSPAQAEVRIYLGVPYYDARPGYDYRYYPGRGWYRPVLPGRFISCSRGIRIVRNAGYRNVRVIECNGPRYTYRATRSGRVFTLSLNARTGRFVRL